MSDVRHTECALRSKLSRLPTENNQLDPEFGTGPIPWMWSILAHSKNVNKSTGTRSNTTGGACVLPLRRVCVHLFSSSLVRLVFLRASVFFFSFAFVVFVSVSVCACVCWFGKIRSRHPHLCQIHTHTHKHSLSESIFSRLVCVAPYDARFWRTGLYALPKQYILWPCIVRQKTPAAAYSGVPRLHRKHDNTAVQYNPSSVIFCVFSVYVYFRCLSAYRMNFSVMFGSKLWSRHVFPNQNVSQKVSCFRLWQCHTTFFVWDSVFRTVPMMRQVNCRLADRIRQTFIRSALASRFGTNYCQYHSIGAPPIRTTTNRTSPQQRTIIRPPSIKQQYQNWKIFTSITTWKW